MVIGNEKRNKGFHFNNFYKKNNVTNIFVEFDDWEILEMVELDLKMVSFIIYLTFCSKFMIHI